MGFFDFLKHFLQDKPKEVKFDELDGWINSWSKNLVEATNSRLLGIKKKIVREKEKTEKNIQKLEQAELQNSNIPEIAKQLMEGNRKAYVQKLNLFLQEVDLPDIVHLECCDSFESSLNSFGKRTIKNHQVLQEFFGDEANAINTNLRNLDRLMQKIKKMVGDSGIEKVAELKNHIKKVQQKITQKQEFKEKIRRLEKGLEEKAEKINGKESSLKELKEGTAYGTAVKLIDKKKLLLKEREDMGKQSSHSFSMVNSALKKYEKLVLDDKLVKAYLDNSLKTLLGDGELKIVGIFNEIKKFITNGKLVLKEKKKKKILYELDKLDRDHFNTFLKKYEGFDKKLDESNFKIENLKIIREIEKLKNGLKEGKIKLEQNQQELEQVIKEAKKISIENLKKNLGVKIKESINEGIEIIF